MEIKTSYFAKMKKYAGNGVGIAICKYPPKGYRGIVYDKLAPTYEMIQGMKNPNTRDFFVTKYEIEILSKLNRKEVLSDLENLTGGKDAILLCYEKSSDFCHRHVIAACLGLKRSETEL